MSVKTVIRHASVASIIAVSLIAAPAMAEQPAAPGGAEPIEQTPTGTDEPAAAAATGAVDNTGIVVTGTRLQSSGFDAPTPVSVISAAEISRAAPTTIADFVNQLPALSGSESPRSPRGNLGSALGGGNFLNLRNLGSSRTLVLLNGRRVTPSTITGITDINVLPSALVSRVDVVTGGASAAWGSDAVAGVVNFVLDTKFTGIKGEVQGGVSKEGDAGNLSAELSYGTSFGGGRGHLLLSGRYSESRAAYFANRDWFKANKLIANPLAGRPGEPARLVVPWTSLLISDNGLIANGPLAGYFFNENGGVAGTNFPFQQVRSGIYLGGNEGVYRRLADQARYGQSNVPLEQGSLYARGEYELSDNVKIFADGSYAKSHSDTTIANYFRAGNSSIAIDNFFLPQQVRQAMLTAGVTTLPFNKAASNLGVLRSEITRENLRGLAGLEGSFGSSWKWDVSYQYGRTQVDIRAPENPIVARYAAAIDAVADPRNPGQAICRSTLANPLNGCVAFNPLGNQPATAAQLGYIVGTSMQDLTYRQQVATANLSGDLFQLPAGAVSLATGVEYRTERASADVDPISAQNGFYAGNYKAFRGKYNVKEVFGELGIPVLRDSALGRSLNLNGAARLTDYSTSGSVVTWKAGFRYEPVEGVELRLTRSRDIRAPNLQELFLAGQVNTQNVSDPFNGGANASFLQTTQGNRALDPEKANTLTAGVVLSPSFMPGFRMSVDYYDIRIDDAIANNSSQFIVNRCFAGDQVYCGAITRNASNVITGINLQPFNALAENARGLDIEVSYRRNVGPGTLDLRGVGNYVSKLDIVSPANTIRRAGEVGNNVGAAEGVPSWRALATATYTVDPLTVQLKGRFIGASKFDSDYTSADISRNRVPSVFYLDAYIGVKVGEDGNGEFFLAGDNILNKAPPVVTPQDNSTLVSAGTNVFIYDTLGTTVRAGFRFKL